MSQFVANYVDQKGERGKIVLSNKDVTEGRFTTFIADLTYCAFAEYSQITTGAFTTPVPLVQSALIENDKDFKCVLTFKNVTDPAEPEIIRISIPAPCINVADGIISRTGDKYKFVPKESIVGELGNDGDALAAEVATLFGLQAADVLFLSGSFTM
jgi:hypothetical protein